MGAITRIMGFLLICIAVEMVIVGSHGVLLDWGIIQDVAKLHGRIQAFFESSMEEEEFVIPYDRQSKVALLHDCCRVLEERYEEDGAHVRVRAPGSLLAGLRREI